MAKVDLVKDVLSHSDAEIVEYLYGLISAVRRKYNTAEDPVWLLSVSGEIDQIYAVLKALDGRNKENDI